MSLDLRAVGHQTAAYGFEYDWKTVALYALGIGAKQDELPFLYEGAGPLVYPTFAVVPAYAPIIELLGAVGIDLRTMVHGAQSITLHRKLPPAARLVTRGRVAAISDMKRLARVEFSTQTTLQGEPCFETTWTMLCMGAGGFGGKPPAQSARVKFAADQPLLWAREETTLPEQALLYRLSGDANPLHADPGFATAAGFDRGPILHGLCTFGYLGRAVVQQSCAGDPGRLRALGAQFRKPVWPGDALTVEAQTLDQERLSLRVRSSGCVEPVVTGAWAQIAQE